jgi:succinate dehydrogenase/fumarate reductase-like Fe-S protein
VVSVKKKALFEVYRQDDKDADGYFKEYTLAIDDSISVYDALWMIRNELDGSLAVPYFRCRKGICGSCLMRINGVQRLACRIPVSNALGDDGIIRVEPPKGRPVLKDLIAGRGDHDEV